MIFLYSNRNALSAQTEIQNIKGKKHKVCWLLLHPTGSEPSPCSISEHRDSSVAQKFPSTQVAEAARSQNLHISSRGGNNCVKKLNTLLPQEFEACWGSLAHLPSIARATLRCIQQHQGPEKWLIPIHTRTQVAGQEQAGKPEQNRGGTQASKSHLYPKGFSLAIIKSLHKQGRKSLSGGAPINVL